MSCWCVFWSQQDLNKHLPLLGCLFSQNEVSQSDMTQKILALIFSENVTHIRSHFPINMNYFSESHILRTKQCNEAVWLSFLSGWPSGCNAFRGYIWSLSHSEGRQDMTASWWCKHRRLITVKVNVLAESWDFCNPLQVCEPDPGGTNARGVCVQF